MSAIDRLMRSMSLDLTNRSSRNSRIHLPESMLVALFSQSQADLRIHEEWPHGTAGTMLKEISNSLLSATANLSMEKAEIQRIGSWQDPLPRS